MLNRLRFVLSTTEGKFKALILVAGAMLILVSLTAVALVVTSTPKFCQSCHEMRPEYVTWQASAHSQISCIDCHIEPGAGNFLIHKVKSLEELYKHFTGQVYAPITLGTPIADKVCERCHSDNRVKTPSGDLKMPHQIHKQNQVPCVSCHAGVVHANVGEVGFTADGKWDKWIEPVGKVYMRSDFTKLSMSDCIKCHTEQGVGPKTDDCKTCHAKLGKPETHVNSQFLNQHGQMAVQDIKQCENCHQFTWKDKNVWVPTNNPAALYAKQNQFCSNCHKQTKPASHGVDWRIQHKVPAGRNRDSCLVCHDEGRVSGSEAAAKTNCYQCHLAEVHSSLQNGHPRYPLRPNQPPVSNPCMKCHIETKCEKCHFIPAT